MNRKIALDKVYKELYISVMVTLHNIYHPNENGFVKNSFRREIKKYSPHFLDAGFLFCGRA